MITLARRFVTINKSYHRGHGEFALVLQCDGAGAARFVESDGDIVKCFMVTDITIDQAEMIPAE